jgi:alkylated DNA repair dioxygenase AlkB
MNYHIDPDQGVLWTDKTAVVSVGDSRYFCVRKIADHSDRHRFLVSGGDVVLMYDDCQEVYQHCVRKEEAEAEAGPRISLVFKESLHRKEERQS